MRKSTFLLNLTFIFSSFLYAQSSVDEVKLQNYTIKLSVNTDKTYGYEIFESDKLIIRQLRKPFIKSLKGFLNKENSIKVAKWHVGKLIQHKHFPNSILSIEEARKMGVTEDEFESLVNQN